MRSHLPNVSNHAVVARLCCCCVRNVSGRGGEGQHYTPTRPGYATYNGRCRRRSSVHTVESSCCQLACATVSSPHGQVNKPLGWPGYVWTHLHRALLSARRCAMPTLTRDGSRYPKYAHARTRASTLARTETHTASRTC